MHIMHICQHLKFFLIIRKIVISQVNMLPFNLLVVIILVNDRSVIALTCGQGVSW